MLKIGCTKASINSLAVRAGNRTRSEPGSLSFCSCSERGSDARTTLIPSLFLSRTVLLQVLYYEPFSCSPIRGSPSHARPVPCVCARACTYVHVCESSALLPHRRAASFIVRSVSPAAAMISFFQPQGNALNRLISRWIRFLCGRTLKFNVERIS